MAEGKRWGGCNCGKVRLEIDGAPMRVGLCHCLICRKETGSPFMAFAVWNQGQVAVTGETGSWQAQTDRRHFCLGCGSVLFATHETDGEIEVRLGTLDEAPSGLAPDYELWIQRREPWLPAVAGADQYTGNCP